ncbi:hypothetical protein [Okeania sp. KiyG1]|nr:hypothetical protein [Okeania sp. KiyG1]
MKEHLGFSIEIGAFVAGLMISEVEYADKTFLRVALHLPYVTGPQIL